MNNACKETAWEVSDKLAILRHLSSRDHRGMSDYAADIGSRQPSPDDRTLRPGEREPDEHGEGTDYEGMPDPLGVLDSVSDGDGSGTTRIPDRNKRGTRNTGGDPPERYEGEPDRRPERPRSLRAVALIGVAAACLLGALSDLSRDL